MTRRRAQEPPERLTNFLGNKQGKCHHCPDGLVGIMRSDTLELQWDKCWCALCGQRYYILPLDRERFLGYDPDLECFGK